MQFEKDISWEEVFDHWREREAFNPGWIECATKIKGWPDWESWRRFTAKQMGASERSWQLFRFTNPLEEIPAMLIGPFSGWQSRVPKKNETTFKELLSVPEQYEHFSKHEGVLSILKGLPFPTEFIGVVREDLNKLVCIEGHHRATAIALAVHQGREIDFNTTPITIALTHASAKESALFEQMLQRGTSKHSD